jgi:plastocyanin
MTEADAAASVRQPQVDYTSSTDSNPTVATTGERVSGMAMHIAMGHVSRPAQSLRASQMHEPAPDTTASSTALNGCLISLNDGKSMLRLLHSSKVYRMEGRPLLFSQNTNRLVHVTGYFGSVVEVEDPHIPSFVVDTLEPLAANCAVRLSAAEIRRTLAKLKEPVAQGTVGMTDMGFVPAAITVNVGTKVVWKNSSQVIHNVVDDASKALSRVDVKLPAGASPFDSGLMQPGQSFSRVFTEPGIYRYVCTLHEGSGMKGVVIVRPAQMLAERR